MDWNNFTPSEFIEFLSQEVFREWFVPKLHKFYDAIYNISTYLDDIISGKHE
jgi:hypothetical protein